MPPCLSAARARAAAPVVLLAVMGAIALVGCGGSSGNGVASKSPDQILAASKAAAESASSVHVAGTFSTGGMPVSLDVSLAAGRGGHGQLSENGLSFELIVVDNTIYIKGSRAFYEHFAGPTAADLLVGKWLKAPANNGQLGTLASLTNLSKILGQTLVSSGSVAKGSSTTVNGQPAVELTDTDKNGSLFVATTGQPFPLQISKGGAEAGKVTFSAWNQPVTLTPPASALDLSQLEHEGH
jgi:hypothetical protein